MEGKGIGKGSFHQRATLRGNRSKWDEASESESLLQVAARDGVGSLESQGEEEFLEL